MKKAVYITGCLGFIGSHVTSACLEKGWFVRGIDSETYASDRRWINHFKERFGDQFCYTRANICDIDYLYDCDYVINTAAETHVDNSIVSSVEFIKSNIDGVHNLLNQICKKKHYTMPTFLHFSTDEVYGDIESGSFTEDSLLKPSNPYSATKAAADMLVTAWGRTHNVPYLIIRPTNNYGIGQYVEKLIPKSVKNLTLGKKIPLHEKGEPTRIWLHASDTADAVVKIIESGRKNEIFNISGDEEYKNIDVVGKIIREYYNVYVDIKNSIDFNFNRPGHDVRYSINDQKIRRELGWSPKRQLFDEIPSIVEYYKENFIW